MVQMCSADKHSEMPQNRLRNEADESKTECVVV